MCPCKITRKKTAPMTRNILELNRTENRPANARENLVPTGGFYVAVKEDDENYLADFPHNCAKCGVPCDPLDIKDVLEMEPALSKDIIAAYRTEDSSIDPFRVSHENLAYAIKCGHGFLPYTEVKGFEIGFDLIDHSADGVDNFQTIAGGKLSIFRLMAERVSDQVCIRLKIDAPCRTRHEPLPSTLNCEWTEPGLSPKTWLEKQAPDDIILCECEMVPKSAVQSISENIAIKNDGVLLHNIGARSRIGKGACQGTYCGLRLTAHLYDQGDISTGPGHCRSKTFYQFSLEGAARSSLRRAAQTGRIAGGDVLRIV